MSDDPSLLALVLDDPLAPKVLAWWKVRKPQGALSREQLGELCRVVVATEAEAAATLERLELAQLFLDGEDGGISVTATKWLGSHVAERIAPKSKKRHRG